MFNRLSIRLKLVVLLGLSATIALFISSAITLASTVLTQRDESLHALRQLADVSSENLRAALAFHDQASAERLLQPLKANPNIRMAMVTDEAGRLFSSYCAPQLPDSEATRYLALTRPAQPTPTEEMGLGEMVVTNPIIFDGQVIGALTIVSDNAALHDKVMRHLGFQILVSLLALTVLTLVSLPLQKLFTRPIYDLINSMRHISLTKDYAVRVTSGRNDEFDSLYAGFNAMLAEIQDRDERLSKLATTDALTEISNRRHALDILDTMVVRANRKSEPLGVIMIDIDHFKSINDCQGHPVGDVVIKEVARLLSGCAREYDLVARFGGEEFLVLCDNSDAEGTEVIAQRIRESVEQHVFGFPGGELRATISLGVFAAVPGTRSGTDMVRLADKALYLAKMNGRNRVELAVQT